MTSMSSMIYTMGTALDRAAENGVAVSVLVEGAWIEGQIAAVDGTGVVLECGGGDHAVVRLDRIAAVTVHAQSPFSAEITRCPDQSDPSARPMPGPVPGPRSA